MSPASYRRRAEKCRQMAAERPGMLCARYLMEQADRHERIASILIELRKINTALPPNRSFARRVETLH